MEIKGYLLDLDGTVYLGEKLIPGADRAVAELRRRGRRIVFLSNKPLHSRADYAEKLSRLGVPATVDDVVHSSYVVARYLAGRRPGARVFAIGEPPLLAELEAAGLEITSDPERIEFVVAAFDRTCTWGKINIAFQAIRRGARFVATNPDPTCPVEGGEIPDAAGIIAALEATTGKKVDDVVGKPSPHTVRAALERLELPADRVAMVGDRLSTDILMARRAGLVGVLTLSGVTRPEELDEADVKPDHVIANLTELPELDMQLAAE